MLIRVQFICSLFFVCFGIELPLAPYNVKVFCRQGLRFGRGDLTAVQCPSSSTACAFFEFPRDVHGNQAGVYDCVDNGILASDEEEEENKPPLWEELCGAVPRCSWLVLDQLNSDFSKYLITQHGIRLENLPNKKIRFCCSLFHSTLQKLITSAKDRLPSAQAPPVYCGSELSKTKWNFQRCGQGSVGCLLHSIMAGSSEEYEDYDYNIRKRRTTSDEDYGVNAVQLSFDYDEGEDAHEFVFKPPLRRGRIETTMLPSLTLPMDSSEFTTNLPPKFVANVKSVKKDAQNEVYRLRLNANNLDEEEDDETVCVYRHLNDENYRYCLLVHQRKDGDRCYRHEGHLICCCFVPPDKETCDPTEMDLVRPPPPARIPSIRITPPSVAVTYQTPGEAPSTAVPSAEPATTTTTTTTTTTMSTTRETITKEPEVVEKPPPRCRVTYPRTKTGKLRPVLVCDSSVKQPIVVVFVFSLLVLLQTILN